MDEMIKLFDSTNRKGQIANDVIQRLSIYSSYEMKAESLETGEERQSFFVPKAEYDFYKSWQQEIKNRLIGSGQNAALIENIMRHHGLCTAETRRQGK